LVDDAGTQIDAQARQQPARQQGADDADADVADQAKAAAPDDQSGELAGDGANDDKNKNFHHSPR
jgi:hypothetical protein